MRILLCLLMLSLAAQARPLKPDWVTVGHTRELRGVWVASVHNLNFPSRPGLSADEQKAELTTLVQRVAACHLNAIFFQVRPEGDALYKSDLEPWSRYLSGTQGQDPGYDPLEFLIQEAHAQGIEVHAWLNPYRASANPVDKTSFVAPHLGDESPDLMVPYGSFVWMEPTSAEVQQRLVDVCRDLIRRYDLDGLHFDDYFYPYPENELDFPDQARWDAYQTSGGQLSRGDWRRDNVNRAIAEVSRVVHQEKSSVRFGISPFGLPSPDRPEGILGFDQYHKLYADPQHWLDRGWVDYLAPQLYWPTTREAQAFAPLIDWWTTHNKAGRYIFPGLNFNALESKPEWTIEEYAQEISLTRNHAEGGANGVIWWSVKPFLENRANAQEALFARIYPERCLTPPIARERERPMTPPRCEIEGDQVSLRNRDRTPLRAWTVYRQQGNDWVLERLLLPSVREVQLEPGRYAIAAVSRHGVESQGQVVRMP